MAQQPICPGCKRELDTVAVSGRPDDLYLCSRCYHSWFRFELGEDEFVHPDKIKPNQPE